MRPENREPFNELYRRAFITARIRFKSARRLSFHQKMTKWSMTIASIALIAMPLSQLLGIDPMFDVKLLTLLEIIYAVVVLAISLIISQDDFATRSERMHRCGLELSNIYREIEPYRNNTWDRKLYEQFSKAYDNTLAQHENHDDIDFYAYSLSDRAHYYPRFFHFCFGLVRFTILWFLSILPYLLLFLATGTLIWFICGNGFLAH
jgi:hypothetical protein